MNRTVECSFCDTRFRINDDVILRYKKFYPGERASTETDGYKRVHLRGLGLTDVQPVRNANQAQPYKLEPTSPQRVIAGFLGVAQMGIIALMFFLSSEPSGLMGAMPLKNMLYLGGFISTISVALLLYASPKARAKAGLFGLLMAAGVLTIPLFVKRTPAKLTESVDSPNYVDPTKPLLIPEAPEDPFTALRERFSTKPLEVEQTRLKSASSEKAAYGIYLTDLLQRNIYTVRDYLTRETIAGVNSHPYPRDKGDYLMVLTDVDMDITEVAKIADLLGTTKAVHSEIGVIEVSVNNEQFEYNSPDKLNNQNDPAFFKLNQRELASIDIDRVRLAVERLTTAKPSIYREDISDILIKLMEKPGIRFHDELSKALLVWLKDPSLVGESALKVLEEHIAADKPVPESLVQLLLKGNNQKAIPSVNTLWLANPSIWERHYMAFGAVIEPSVIEQLGSENAGLGRSAINILGQIGTESSLSPLGQIVVTKDPEFRVLAERAIKAIKER